LLLYRFFPQNKERPPTAEYGYHSGITALEQIFQPKAGFDTFRGGAVIGFSRDEHDPRKLVAETDKESTDLSQEAWTDTVENNVVGLCFAVSTNGYFALVLPWARPRDVLCLLVGGETAYVVRPILDESSAGPSVFFFIGEAYVHGLMQDGIGKLSLKQKLGFREFRV